MDQQLKDAINRTGSAQDLRWILRRELPPHISLQAERLLDEVVEAATRSALDAAYAAARGIAVGSSQR